MINSQQIHPLTDFLRNHKAHIARITETQVPEILTVNGKAALIIQDAVSYQRLVDAAERANTIEAIRAGLASAERGELKSAEQLFHEMKAKYDVQG